MSLGPKIKNGPVYEEGRVSWYLCDRLHSIKDYPAVTEYDGTKKWYKHGNLHRITGPAIEHSNGSKEYWIDGKRHREDGPAIIYIHGTTSSYLVDQDKDKEDVYIWFYKGKHIKVKSQEEFEKLLNLKVFW